MDWFLSFPHMPDDALRMVKKTIDDGFRVFTRSYGEAIEGLFTPLQTFMIWSERLLTQTPWPIVIVVIALVAYLASRSRLITVGTILTLLLIGWFDMWTDTMRTISMILVCTFIAIIVGLPIGIAMIWASLPRSVEFTSWNICRTSPYRPSKRASSA